MASILPVDVSLSTNKQLHSSRGMDNTSIIIVGGGSSGFAAASKLLSNNFQNVRILEAENRIGGRVNTIPFGANVVDMGGQWCHGEDGNVVYQMAHDKNLLSSNVPRYETFNFVRSNGETIPANKSKKLVDLSSNILNRNDRRNEKRAYHGSLGNYYAGRFYEALRGPEFSDIDTSLQHETFDWFHQFRNMYIACDSWYNASCGNYLEYRDCPGDLLLNWKGKGYRTVLDLLQNKIPEGASNVIDVESKVLLNKEVKKITYDATSSAGNRIKIECSDASEYECAHLICTFSLGVLKRHHLNMFEPLLPRKKIESIESMAFGTVNKIYVEFVQPFWDSDWEGISMLWQSAELKKIREENVMNWNWMKNIVGFYTVSFQPNVLCGWISGDSARQMERASDDEFQAGVKRVLKTFLPSINEENIKNIIRSKWNSNPHFFGSYSYYSLKSDSFGASTTTLSEPILDHNSKPIIQFAGEATSTQYYSTVHGAIGTGWREAQRLIDLYNN